MKKVYPYLVLIVSIGLTCGAGLFNEAKTLSLRKDQNLHYLPSGAFLRGASLSFDEVVADLLWIKTIGYFSDELYSQGQFTWLFHLLDVTTTLDPLYEDIYEVGGIVLTNDVGSPKDGLDILERGLRNVPEHHPRYYYLLFFSAFNYMYHQGDYQKAAQYLERASKYPNSPEYLPLLAARLYANSGEPSTAIPFLQEMLRSARSEVQKNKIQDRINSLQNLANLAQLNDAVRNFFNDEGKYPKNLQELLVKKYISHIPQDPKYGNYYFDLIINKVLSTSDYQPLDLKFYQ